MGAGIHKGIMMKKALAGWGGGLGAVALAGLLLTTGCEKDLPSGASFRIEPERVVLTTQSAVALTAVGGEAPLQWRVTDTNLGAVSGGGETVTYTRNEAEGANSVEVTDARGWVAAARVIQASAMTLSPAGPLTLAANGAMATLVCQGGLPPYSWSVARAELGRVDASDSGAQAVYTRLGAGQNTVVATDREGESALVLIEQPADTPASSPAALQVAPASGTINTVGQSLAFTASGGIPPYTWSVNDGTRGTIVSTGNTTALYTRYDFGENVVVLRDSVGNAAYAIVNQP